MRGRGRRLWWGVPDDDHALAARVAADAGKLLVELRAGWGAAPPRLLGDEGDLRSHGHIVAALHAARPADAVRSEEAYETPAGREHAGARRVWVVDPLDGTREYSEGRVDFAVHVALVVNGAPVVGAVALPGEQLVFATGGGALAATSADAPGALPRDGRMRVAVSRTRPPIEARRVAGALDAELVPMGSAGAKTMAVVRGDVDAYVHAGGQYEWDSAAPVAVALERGFCATRLDGSPLVYDRFDPWLPDLVVCRADLATAVRAALDG
jgi:3'(2'), 5'-bisphosphate nucleotidase